MTNELARLIELARKVEVSSESRESQRRSFAFGNTHFENSMITREMVDRAAEELLREASSAVHERK